MRVFFPIPAGPYTHNIITPTLSYYSCPSLDPCLISNKLLSHIFGRLLLCYIEVVFDNNVLPYLSQVGRPANNNTRPIHFSGVVFSLFNKLHSFIVGLRKSRNNRHNLIWLTKES